MELKVNGHAGRIASVAELRRNFLSFASQQFREIWVSMDSGGPRLCGHMNTNAGCLMYLRYDQGDTGFTSRNPMYDESDTLGGLAFDGRYGTEKHVPVMTYRWSNGMEEEFPASWALPASDIVRPLEYFVEHEGRRSRRGARSKPYHGRRCCIRATFLGHSLSRQPSTSKSMKARTFADK
jgi:hypothetical protein